MLLEDVHPDEVRPSTQAACFAIPVPAINQILTAAKKLTEVEESE